MKHAALAGLILVYAWNNHYNAAPCDLKVRRIYPREEEYLQEGRDFFNAPKPGYTPLAYPHPVVAADAATPDR